MKIGNDNPLIYKYERGKTSMTSVFSSLKTSDDGEDLSSREVARNLLYTHVPQYGR